MKAMFHPGSAAAISGVVGSIDYSVVNARGTVLFTSPDEDLAKAWLRDRAAQWPGAQVDEICRWETRRRVYRPVRYLRVVAS